MDSMQISDVADIGESTFPVTLPDDGPRGPMTVLCRKLLPAEAWGAIGSIPVLGVAQGTVADSEVAARLTRQLDAMRESWRVLAERGIVRPAFSFGDAPEEGKAWWFALSFANQKAIIDAVISEAGLGITVRTPEAIAAARGATFPAREAAGSGDGTPPAEPRPA